MVWQQSDPSPADGEGTSLSGGTFDPRGLLSPRIQAVSLGVWSDPLRSYRKWNRQKKNKRSSWRKTTEEKEARLKTRCAEGGLTAHRCSIHTFHSLRQKNWRHSNRWSPPQVRWVESLQRRRCSSHQGGTGWVNEKTDGERKAKDKGQLPKGRRAPCFSRPNAIYWKKCQRDLHNGWKCEDLPVWFILILKKCQA